jgi:glutamate racemase
MIGIFDSGLGGLSVLREMKRKLPACDFLYYGDTARGPYDDKSPELVAARTAEGLSCLEEMGAGLLVVADHAAAACLTSDTRKRFAIPLFDIVSHGVVPGTGGLSAGAVGIIGPTVVETAGAHRAAVETVLPDTRIFSAAAPLLAPLVDAGWLKKPETVMIAKKYLHFFKLRQIQALVLGSNHYSLLSSVIQRKIGKRVRLVSGIPELAGAVKNLFQEQPELEGRCTGDGACRAVVSDLAGPMEKNARMFFGKNIRLEQI